MAEGQDAKNCISNGKEHTAAQHSASVVWEVRNGFDRASSQSAEMMPPPMTTARPQIWAYDGRTPKSKMTSQQRIDREVEKRRLKNHEYRRVSQQGVPLPSTHSNLRHGSSRKPLDEGPLSALTCDDGDLGEQHDAVHLASSHPLDDVSTDDEYEELAKGTAVAGLSGIQADRHPHRPALNEDIQDIAEYGSSLPTYSASQRKNARESMLREDRSIGNKRKRKQRSPKNSGGIPNLPTSFDSEAMGPQTQRKQPKIARSKSLTRSIDFAFAPRGVQDESQAGRIDLDADNALGAVDWDMPTPSDSRVYYNSTDPDLFQDQTQLQSSDPDISESVGVNDEKPYLSPYIVLDRRRESSAQTPTANDTTKQSERQVRRSATAEDAGRDRQAGSPSSTNHFGAKEYSMIEGYRTSWCILNDKQPSDFNNAIHSRLRSDPMRVAIFKDLAEMFPDHKSQYILRACRRKFHNFERRGVWTEEEDERLRQTVNEKGTSWKAVSDELGRFWEDCRDRYRNYLLNDNNRNKHTWTDVETLNLAGAIIDCVQASNLTEREENRDLDSRNVIDDLVLHPESLDRRMLNWQSVSDRMGRLGGARSRMQCVHKWKRLLEGERKGLLFRVAQARWPGSFDTDEAHEIHPRAFGWRIAATMSKMRNMLVGDKFDILEAISDSEAVNESHIPWATLGDDWLCRRWTPREKKAAWLIMKESAHTAESRNYQELAQTLLSSLPQEERDERWDSSSYVSKHDHLKKKHANAEAKKRGTVGDSAANPVNLDDGDEEDSANFAWRSSPILSQMQQAIDHGSQFSHVGHSGAYSNDDHGRSDEDQYEGNDAEIPLELKQSILALQYLD